MSSGAEKDQGQGRNAKVMDLLRCSLALSHGYRGRIMYITNPPSW